MNSFTRPARRPPTLSQNGIEVYGWLRKRRNREIPSSYRSGMTIRTHTAIFQQAVRPAAPRQRLRLAYRIASIEDIPYFDKEK